MFTFLFQNCTMKLRNLIMNNGNNLNSALFEFDTFCKKNISGITKLTFCITLIHVIIILSVEPAKADAGKYSRSLNEMHRHEQNQNMLHGFVSKEENKPAFRKHKIKLIWEKAEKRLSDTEKAEFLRELSQQDSEEMMLKKSKQSSGDPDGLEEARLRERLREILRKYRLEDILPSAGFQRNLKSNELSSDLIKQHFKDKKIQGLWEKAKRSTFSDVELEDLFKELKHHQEKVDEYHQLSNLLNEGISDNIVANSPGNSATEKLSRDSLKQKHRELREEYFQLSGKFPTIQNDKEIFMFNKPQVQELWIQAKAANFSEEDLASIKVELQHFENKIEKLSQFHETVTENGSKAKKHDVLKAQEKRQKLKDKVDSYYLHIQERIQSRHKEL